MKFALLLYCATVPAEVHPAYDCVSVSVHADKQAAMNAAHEWCLFDHVCVHHTYLQEIELGPQFHHVATDTAHNAEDYAQNPDIKCVIPEPDPVGATKKQAHE